MALGPIRFCDPLACVGSNEEPRVRVRVRARARVRVKNLSIQSPLGLLSSPLLILIPLID